MAGFQLIINSDFSGGQSALDELESRATGPMTKAMKNIGAEMMRSVGRSFETGGQLKKWKPSRRVEKYGGQTLRQFGKLLASISPRVGDAQVAVGTRDIRARLLFLGGPMPRRRGYRSKAHGKIKYSLIRPAMMPRREYIEVTPGVLAFANKQISKAMTEK